MFLPKSKKLHWTFHARAKMAFYGLSEQRVRRVMNSPKRVEEGIAPKTVAMMQPVSYKTSTCAKALADKPTGRPASAETTAGESASESGRRGESWNREIWVMVQDEKSRRKIISAWRYPGRTKPRDEIAREAIISAYREYMTSAKK